LLAAVEARFQKQAVIEESADKKLEALRESLRFALPHELVTPLNTILGFAGLLLEQPEPRGDQVREYASHIRQAGERLRSLVEKFLVYAQVELAVAGNEHRTAFSNRPASPTEEVITNAAQRVAQEQNRASDLLLQVSPLAHAISPSHLERLVRELVENACKFSRPGEPVRVVARKENRDFVLQLIDQGRGFTPEQIRQVSANIQFDRKMSEQQGTGLGLAIARRIAQLYGGELAFHSLPEESTTVTVRLPL
jgi:two-component system, sensor histidine kinase and response regulator